MTKKSPKHHKIAEAMGTLKPTDILEREAQRAARPPNKDPKYQLPIDTETQFRCLGCNMPWNLDDGRKVKPELVGFKPGAAYVIVCPECERYSLQHLFNN